MPGFPEVDMHIDKPWSYNLAGCINCSGFLALRSRRRSMGAPPSTPCRVEALGEVWFSLKSFNLTTLTLTKMISLTIKTPVIFFYHGQKMGQWRVEEALHCAVAKKQLFLNIKPVFHLKSAQGKYIKSNYHPLANFLA